MSYNPLTDFLALIRNGSGASVAEIPGLDYVVASLARAELFKLSAGQTAPTVNQANTAWLKTSSPSWVAEGVVFLWNANTAQYETATPALWAALLNPAGGVAFQSIATSAGIIANGTTLFAIQRAGPAATVLTLPSVFNRGGKALQLVDWSIDVVNHTITVNAAAGQTLMQRASFQFLSTADQFAGVTLYPSIDLNGWVIAP